MKTSLKNLDLDFIKIIIMYSEAAAELKRNWISKKRILDCDCLTQKLMKTKWRYKCGRLFSSIQLGLMMTLKIF